MCFVALVFSLCLLSIAASIFEKRTTVIAEEYLHKELAKALRASIACKTSLNSQADIQSKIIKHCFQNPFITYLISSLVTALFNASLDLGE